MEVVGDDERAVRRGTWTGMVALAVTLAIQSFVSLAATATSVLAPEVAAAFGLSPKLVGVFVGLMYTGSIAASVASGWAVERYGAIRASQICVVLCAVGVGILGVLPPTLRALLVIVPVIIGLGYGPITPASSQVLARTTAPERMAITFSIKQTGVPGGVALGGVLLPWLTVLLGWRCALLAVAVLGSFIAVAAQPTRAVLDCDRRSSSAPSLAALFAPLRLVLRSRPLLELSVVGFAYGCSQACLMSYLVVYLNEELGYSLVGGGVALTFATFAGIVGRIAWGGVADFWISPRVLLGILGLLGGGCAGLVSLFAPSWPRFAVLVVCALFGATAVGWNGVQLAEVARNSPDGRAGFVTGGTIFITYIGMVLGPPTFALVAAVSAGYRTGFALCGLLAAVCGAWLLLRPRRCSCLKGRGTASPGKAG